MARLMVHWILSALSLVIVAQLIPGFDIRGFGTALIAAVVIGLINTTIGFILKIMTFPITILTFGLFLFVINAMMLLLAASFVSGFVVDGFVPALFGAIVLALVNAILRHVVF